MLRRLIQSKIQKAPLSLSRLARIMKGKEEKVAVLVGTITDDNRLLEVPKLTVCALRFTETARARILKAGGKCLSFDELVMTCPQGKASAANAGSRLEYRAAERPARPRGQAPLRKSARNAGIAHEAVSYTHLTLPTNREV